MSDADFFDNVLEGNQIKEVVKVLLEKAGYLVLPYCCESTLSGLRRRLGERGTKKSRTVRRIRASPDLLVYDDERKDLMLEVKMRKAKKETKILIYGRMMPNYKEFWNDSILVVVVPCGDIFYAQKVGELEVKEAYNAKLEFEKFQDVFVRVKPEDLSHYKNWALQIMMRKTTTRNP